jgi:hypothetical protein
LILQLKILKGLSGSVVKKRALRFKRQTNRAVKAYALWIYFKNLTESGFIQNIESQLPAILEQLKISRGTFYNWLKYAKELQLINKQGNTIQLTSYAAVIEELSLPGKEFIYINYDTEHKKQKIEHIIDVLEFHENHELQTKAIEWKLSHNSIIMAAFKFFWLSKGQPDLPFNLDNLKKAQTILFESGAAQRIYEPLMDIVNPVVGRNSNTIRMAHNYKSRRGVTYLKRKLKRLGLIGLYQPEKSTCFYKQDLQKGTQRGKNTNAFCFYNNKNKTQTWYKLQTILVNPFLFVKNNQNENQTQRKTA